MSKKKNNFFTFLLVILAAIFASGAIVPLFKSDKKESSCEHEWESEIVKAATCTEVGERKYVCELCGEEELAQIPKAAHVYGDDGLCVNCGADILNCEHADSLDDRDAVCDYCGEPTQAIYAAAFVNTDESNYDLTNVPSANADVSIANKYFRVKSYAPTVEGTIYATRETIVFIETDDEVFPTVAFIYKEVLWSYATISIKAVENNQPVADNYHNFDSKYVFSKYGGATIYENGGTPDIYFKNGYSFTLDYEDENGEAQARTLTISDEWKITSVTDTDGNKIDGYVKQLDVALWTDCY